MTVDDKTFRGSFLLYRKNGKGMRRANSLAAEPGQPAGRAHQPRFRHPDRASAAAEAERLLAIYPQSTFLILQEVGRVKLQVPAQADG